MTPPRVSPLVARWLKTVNILTCGGQVVGGTLTFSKNKAHSTANNGPLQQERVIVSQIKVGPVRLLINIQSRHFTCALRTTALNGPFRDR